MTIQRTVAAMTVALAFSLCAGTGLRGQGAGDQLDPALEALVEKYLGEVRGVGGRQPAAASAATSVRAGGGGRDGFTGQLDGQRAILKELQALDKSRLAMVQRTDARFLESILKSNIREGEQVRRDRQDPRRYLETNPISFKLQADPRHPEERGQDLVRDLQSQQTRLANAKTTLTEYMPKWQPYTNARIDGTILYFEQAMPAFARRLSPALGKQLVDENTKSMAALKDFRVWVNTEWPKKPQGDFKIGAELFNFLQAERHLFDGNELGLRTIARGAPNFTQVPAYYEWGWKQYRIVEKMLEARAAQIDPAKTWLQIVKQTKRDHPAAEQLVYEGLKVARRTREWTIKNDLVTIPWDDDDQIMVASDPSMSASQWWGFGPGYLPTAHMSKKMAWPIIPIHPDWTDEVAEENLIEKDWSFTYAIGPHEAYPGHHLMRLYQNRNPRKLRVYHSSYSDQAWCYYVEWELTPDPDYAFFPKDKQALYSLEVLRLKLWRMGRVIIDAGLHTGALSWEEAVNIESNRTGFVRRGAEINIDGITTGGTGTAAPTVGYFQWMQLRDEYFNKMRELDQKGTLKDFHDRVYKIGFLPVTLVREEMFHTMEQEFRKPRSATSAGQ